MPYSLHKPKYIPQGAINNKFRNCFQDKRINRPSGILISKKRTLIAKLGFYLVNFIVKIYYQLCCLAFHVQLESPDLLSKGFFQNNA